MYRASYSDAHKIRIYRDPESKDGVYDFYTRI